MVQIGLSNDSLILEVLLLLRRCAVKVELFGHDWPGVVTTDARRAEGTLSVPIVVHRRLMVGFAHRAKGIVSVLLMALSSLVMLIVLMVVLGYRRNHRGRPSSCRISITLIDDR